MYWWLVVIEVILHFIIDRLKSGKYWLGRYNNPNTSIFWISLGLDQMLHMLTYIWIVSYKTLCNRFLFQLCNYNKKQTYIIHIELYNSI